MAGLKSLAKDTAIYGVSSIVGRFLNYLLVPLYTSAFSASSGGYGVVTNVYSITALLLVFLTYGMETGFFRFANKNDENSQTVYSTTLISVGGTSLLFILVCFILLEPISNFLGYGDHPEYIGMMVVVVAVDAFQSILYAYLRYKKRPVKFACLKLLFIFSNILLNLFLIVWAPLIYENYPDLISWFYNPDYGVGYVFVANLICTLGITFFFIPELRIKLTFDKQLHKRILKYSFPILILGVAGILNQTVDKIIFPFVMGKTPEASVQLGIYGAASKVAMIMAMFTQAFRYAYEPFVFGSNKEKDSRHIYANAMKFFIIFALFAYLAVMFYLDLLKYIIAEDYWVGLDVVPIVMMAELFMGIYFNLSFWYKLIDETKWGAYFSLIGCIIVIALNIIFIPVYGYMACAWAGLAGYGVAMLLSYIIGQKKYPIQYDIKRIAGYGALAIVLYLLGMYIPIDNIFPRLIFRTVLLFVFIIYIIKKDFPLRHIPVINRLIKK